MGLRQVFMVHGSWLRVEGAGFPRALPTETKVESGTSQSKSGTFLNLSNSGFRLDLWKPPETRTSTFLFLFFFFITLKPKVG